MNRIPESAYEKALDEYRAHYDTLTGLRAAVTAAIEEYVRTLPPVTRWPEADEEVSRAADKMIANVMAQAQAEQARKSIRREILPPQPQVGPSPTIWEAPPAKAFPVPTVRPQVSPTEAAMACLSFFTPGQRMEIADAIHTYHYHTVALEAHRIRR